MKLVSRFALTTTLALAIAMPSTGEAQTLFGSGAGQCTGTNWGELADVDDAWDGDAAGSDGFSGAGLMWYGEMHALDVDAYFDCWDTPPAPSSTGYGNVLGKVVALGYGQLTAQSMSWSPFRLASLSVGTGWTGAKLTFNGYLNSWADTPWTATTTVFAGGPIPWLLNTPDIRFFTIGVEFETDDPFNAAEYQYPINDINEPYKTYFVSSVNYAVPEPGTFGLVAAGLAGLAAVARRRRSTK